MNKLTTFLSFLLLIVSVSSSKLYGAEITTFPYIESFEYVNIATSAWTQYRLGTETENNWTTSDASFFVKTGVRSLFHEKTNNNAEDWLVSPQIHIPADAVYLLSFWTVDQSYSYANGNNALYISKGSPDPADGKFEKKIEIPTTLPDWEKFYMALNEYAGEDIYLAFRYEGIDSHRWHVEDLSIIRLFPSDAGVIEISRPASGANLTSSETVTVKVKNFGSQSLSNIPVRFEINGVPVATEIIQEEIASQTEASYIFTAKAGLSAVGTHTIKAYTVLNGDGDASNDTTALYVENYGDCRTNAVFPFTEGFEDDRAYSCWNIYNQDDNSSINWNISQLEPRTGKRAIYHTYGENEEGWLVTPKMLIPATGVYELSFWSYNRDPSYYNYSSAVYGKNSVLISEGSGNPADGKFQEVWSPASVTDSWVETVISLAGYAGKEIYIAFRCENYNAHIWYIDDVSIFSLPAYDAAITALTAPVKGKNLTNETVTIKAKNTGYEALPNDLPVRLEVNGEIIATETIPGPVASKQEVTYSFSAKADLSEVKQHAIKVYTVLEGDAKPENDTLSVNVINYGTGLIDAFPYIQDFENDDNLFLWTQETTDRNTTWTYRKGAGIGNLENKPHSGSRNAYFYSEYGSGTYSKLITPPLKLNNITAPVLKFWYGQEKYYNSSGPDELRIYYKDSKTAAWKKLYEDKTEKTEWTEKIIELPNPSEEYYIAFEGIARIGSGIVLDDVEITTAFNQDAALTAMLSPVTNINLSATDTVTIRLKNMGAQTISEIPVRLKVNEQPAISEMISRSLSTFEEIEYTFDAPVNLSEEKIHRIEIYLDLPGDEYRQNDTLVVEVENYGNKAILGREAAFTSCGVVFTDEGVNQKYSNQGDTLLIATFYPAETGKRVKAGFTAFHTQDFEIFMGMPIYGDTLFVYDGNILEEKFKIGVLAGDLSENLPEPFVSHAADGSLTFVFKKVDAIPQDGWEALISCITPDPYDAGVIAVLSPFKGGNADAPVTIEIKNNGGEPLSSVNVAYRFKGGEPVTGQYKGTIPPGLSAEYTFAQTVDVSSFDDDYTIEAYTLLDNDSDRSNDTVSVHFTYRENIVLQGYRTQANLPAEQRGGVSFNSNEPAIVTPIRPVMDSDNIFCAGERAGDFIYLYTYSPSVAYTVNFIKYTKEWEFVSKTVVSGVSAWPIEMAYDYSTNVMYALTYPGDGEGSNVYTVDLNTGEMRLFGQIPDEYIVGLACHSETLYTVTVWGYVIAIHLQTRDVSFVCSTEFFAPYLQSLACDPQSGRLFWAMKNEFSSRLIEIDPTTGRWFDFGRIGEDAQIIGLHVPYEGTGITVPQTDDSSIAVYPNPSDGQVTISNVPEKSTIRLLDLSGKTIETHTGLSGKVELNLKLVSGIYLIQIENKNERMVRKLIIKH
jgi:hypothetical protein